MSQHRHRRARRADRRQIGGKSDLALRLIDRGATLISDDYTLLQRAGRELIASPPDTIAGRSRCAARASCRCRISKDPVALLVRLVMRQNGCRWRRVRRIAGLDIREVAIDAHCVGGDRSSACGTLAGGKA